MSEPAVGDIEKRAYHLWEQAGYPSGDGKQFWFQAEGELREETKVKPAEKGVQTIAETKSKRVAKLAPKKKSIRKKTSAKKVALKPISKKTVGKSVSNVLEDKIKESSKPKKEREAKKKSGKKKTKAKKAEKAEKKVKKAKKAGKKKKTG